MPLPLRLLLARTPCYLIVYPTSRCNACCPHCYNHRRQAATTAENELTLAEYESLAASLPDLVFLTISGGEPLLRTDLGAIIAAFCRHAPVRYVSLHTNGTFPRETEELVTELHARFPRLHLQVCVSIDGIGTAHDRWRGLPGGYAAAMETLSRLQQLALPPGRLQLQTATIFSTATAATCGSSSPGLPRRSATCAGGRGRPGN